MKVINIKWDTDGDMDVLADLPTEIEIPEGITNLIDISAYILKVTGFYHKGFNLDLNDDINMRHLCYDLYKVDWKRTRITPEREMKNIKKYYNFLMNDAEFDEDINEYTYDNFVYEYGYDGELYVYYNEFLQAEYMDREYIKYLLNDDTLYQKYLKDLERGNNNGTVE